MLLPSSAYPLATSLVAELQPSGSRLNALLEASTSAASPDGQLSYVPHSGWGNQVKALTNALFLAQALRRTLVVPRALPTPARAKGLRETRPRWNIGHSVRKLLRTTTTLQVPDSTRRPMPLA